MPRFIATQTKYSSKAKLRDIDSDERNGNLVMT